MSTCVAPDMARNVIVDRSFLIALLNVRDLHNGWAAIQAAELPPPWLTCEAVLSEAFHLGTERLRSGLALMMRRGALSLPFVMSANQGEVLSLIEKYRQLPMSLADACLVRMTETIANPIVLAIDHHFRIYRRHGRQVVPCKLPE
jgi:uncharacterized protein